MSEELQRYLKLKGDGQTKYYRGDILDGFEHFILGSTNLKQLKEAGIIEDFITEIAFSPRLWNGTPSQRTQPDEIVLDQKHVVLVVERKTSAELNSQKKEEEAAEQCLTYMQQTRSKLGVVTDYNKFIWINDPRNNSTEIRYIYDLDELFSEDYRHKDTIKKVINNLDDNTDSLYYPPAIDPSKLADKVWQKIWLATHEEPTLCLGTFVEFFLYKFLSDLEVLPINLRMDRLYIENKKFLENEGISQIEYYVQKVRPKLKELFPEKSSILSPIANFTPGSDATSIINGFAFLEPTIANHHHPLNTFNPNFMSIIKDFIDFGKITKIDSEFKSKVYEKFLRKDSKQKKLGQHLTPRVIVRAILKMANIKKLLRDGNKSICDPSSGVGGFLLEGLLHERVMKDNLLIEGDILKWKAELVGLEVDRQTNILAKANMLIHLAETYKELNKKQKNPLLN